VKKIGHFYAVTHNWGDLGSAQGIKTILRSIDPDLGFLDINVNQKKVNPFKFIKLQRELNGLILGGGGVLYNRPKYASGFNFNLNYNQYSALSIPKAFYGIGINVQKDQGARWNMNLETEESIKKFSTATDLVGVRDYTSLNFMKNLNANDAELVPCPSALLLYKMYAKQRKNTVAVNLTTRGVDLRILRSILQSISKFFIHFKIQPVLVIHDYKEDKKCINLAKSFGINYFIPSSSENLMEFYKNQRFLVGMRGHSLIFGTGAKLPMIALSYNEKCDAHMQLIGMEKFIVPKTKFTDQHMLNEQFTALMDQEMKIRESLNESLSRFYKMNIQFADKFVNMLYLAHKDF
jgi:polysaccharide pyruvyl transferase WcaK-like protein